MNSKQDSLVVNIQETAAMLKSPLSTCGDC